MTKYHESVLVKEVLDSLHLNTGSQIIDATLGTGGHSEAILALGAKVLGIEMDPKMIRIAGERLASKNIIIVQGNFTDIEKIANNNNFSHVDGILFDLGVSNLHLKEDGRGFSFENPNQILDMRLNTETQSVRAMDLLNILGKKQLIELFSKVMKYKDARNMAFGVFNHRPIETIADLEKVVTREDLSFKSKKINLLTLPLLALRIAVNSELENLEEVLPKAISLLKTNGKLLVITFHSEEEKIIEKVLKGNFEIKLPSSSEIKKNNRSRSAKLYVYEKK
jgi:16S rRNA (cytosine1402-N4)-methyltransferase